MGIEKLTDRLDVETERLIEHVGFSYHRSVLTAPSDEYLETKAALRSRIRELIEQARTKDAERLDFIDSTRPIPNWRNIPIGGFRDVVDAWMARVPTERKISAR